MKIIGIMTGNSLDACDVVLTEFKNGSMKDIVCLSEEIPNKLQKDILNLKSQIKNRVLLSKYLAMDSFFIKTHDDYIKWIARTINKLLFQENLKPNDVDLIGFHGQTLDHNPPSVSTKELLPYTLQMGSGQMLANLTMIPVVYDFRSDDVFLNGEGAPLIPPHNEHFAKNMGLKNAFFYNAGNTSNLAMIKNGKVILGFDAGPFNEFNDKIVRRYKNIPFDKDGFFAKQGALDKELLKKLFYESVRTRDGKNFLELSAPKSADPSLYFVDDLLTINDEKSFVDTLHTLSYFSGYVSAFALMHIKEINDFPNDFVLFGGGWNNPIAFQSFSDILNGIGFVLLEHEKIFTAIRKKLKNKVNFIFPEGGKYMEARLMADLAYHFEKKIEWGDCSITGCDKASVLGIKATPNQNKINYNDYISRASEGWQFFREECPQ